ncbi:MAG TPA: hypothetical protein VGM26_08685 [Rhizomicrobium sp.]|jgi:hypothetical protein
MDTAIPRKSPIAESFARQGYVVIRSLVEAPQTAAVRAHLEQCTGTGAMNLHDTLVPQTPAIYGDSIVDRLMGELLPRIEFCTGLALYPTYSYARIYKHGDRLPPHRDRPACEISISLNLGQVPDEPWPLYLRNNIGAVEAILKPGDALLYRGIDLTHWREPYDGQSLAQVFMHYVDQNGPHAGERFDRRDRLGAPLAAR